VRKYIRRLTDAESPFDPRLTQIDFELTERCNNNCVHCCINLPENDEQARRRELTTGQAKDILTQASEIGYLQVRFTGGEPLLRSDFEELYLFARKLGMKVLLFTNGRLITLRLAQLFSDIPPLVPIEITVYGMRRESYEAVTRVPGSFDQFRRGIDLLLKSNVEFIVKTALLPANRHEMDEFEAWAKEIPWMTQRPMVAMWFDFRHRRDDPAKNRLIASLRPTAEEGLAVYLRHRETYRKWTPELAAKLLNPPGDRLFTCGIHQGLGSCVDAYGFAQPCLGIRAAELTVDIAGPDRRANLREALKRFARLGDLRATNADYLRRCAVCFLKGICEQCPAKSWAANGTLDTPVEYLCSATHAMARWMGWLGEGEHGWEVQDWLGRIKQ